MGKGPIQIRLCLHLLQIDYQALTLLDLKLEKRYVFHSLPYEILDFSK